MEANQITHDEQVKRNKTHEGPRNHIIAYIISILLTALAFIAVIYRAEVDTTFILIFIIGLAILQASLQAGVWMHMKDKDHEYPRVFLLTAVLFTATFVVMAVFWVWW